MLLWAAGRRSSYSAASCPERRVSPACAPSRRCGLPTAARGRVGRDPTGAADLVALGSAAAVAVGAAFFPRSTGDVFVDGSSYGSGRRMALRAPTGAAARPTPARLGGDVAAAALAPRSWRPINGLAGGAALVIGGPDPCGSGSFHAPAGAPVDRLRYRQGWCCTTRSGQPEPTLFLRRSVRRLAAGAGPAPDALDLTQGAFAPPPLQLDLAAPADMLISHGRSNSRDIGPSTPCCSTRHPTRCAPRGGSGPAHPGRLAAAP